MVVIKKEPNQLLFNRIELAIIPTDTITTETEEGIIFHTPKNNLESNRLIELLKTKLKARSQNNEYHTPSIDESIIIFKLVTLTENVKCVTIHFSEKIPSANCLKRLIEVLEQINQIISFKVFSFAHSNSIPFSELNNMILAVKHAPHKIGNNY